MYIDAHCHLEREYYGDELDAVIERAFAADLSHLVAIGASGICAGADEAIALTERYPTIFAAVAIHPHQASAFSPDDREALVQCIATKLAHPKVVALGEIGLDYFYDFSTPQAQLDLFERFLRLAKDLEIPVMLHIREPQAHDDCFRLLDTVGLSPKGGVVHCFSAGPREASAYLDRGLDLSIPGIVTFKNATELREAVRLTPIDRLLVETDAPYLAPVPHRGKRNEPAWVTATAAAVGALKGLDGPTAGKETRRNAIRLFGLDSTPQPGNPRPPR